LEVLQHYFYHILLVKALTGLSQIQGEENWILLPDEEHIVVAIFGNISHIVFSVTTRYCVLSHTALNGNKPYQAGKRHVFLIYRK
jgi:hypothetical protein